MAKKAFILGILWLLMLASAQVAAQNASNRRYGTRQLDSTAVSLDSLSILPGSFNLI